MIDLQTAYAIADSADKEIVATLVDKIKPALIDLMEDGKADTLAATLGDKRIGRVSLCRRTSESWEIADHGLFDPFAEENLMVETVTVDASVLPDDVLHALHEVYPEAVKVDRGLCDWASRVTSTPAGPVLDTGELVPGVALVEHETSYLRFTPNSKDGWTRDKVLAEALDGGYIGQALASGTTRPALEGGDHGQR